MATPAPFSKDNEPPDDSQEIGTRFYAIGDVPYTNRESNELKVQIEELQKDAEFLIHVGDIRSARDGSACVIEEYHAVADILNKSHAPVFIVLGGKQSICGTRQELDYCGYTNLTILHHPELYR